MMMRAHTRLQFLQEFTISAIRLRMERCADVVKDAHDARRGLFFNQIADRLWRSVVTRVIVRARPKRNRRSGGERERGMEDQEEREG